MRAALFCLTTLLLPVHAGPPVMPSWLAPYPGAEPALSSTSTSTTARYSTPAPTSSVLTHCQAVFAAAGIAFQPNADGIGHSVRAAAPGCSLLITIREAAAGTAVKAVCTAPSSSPSAGSPVNIPVENHAAPSSRPFGQTSGLPQSIEEARRRMREHHERTMAEAEARSRQRTDSMRKFDNPVYPGSSSSRSFYNNDAPPLQWPSWLVATGSAQSVRPVARTVNGQPTLEFTYRTTAPMTDIHQFYDDLLKANGFRVYNASLATGQTLKKVVQNRDGHVEGDRSENGQVNGPRTIIRASFGRTYLNQPITVHLTVRTKGSFGRP